MTPCLRLALILSVRVLLVRPSEYTTEFELILTDYQNPEDTLITGSKCDQDYLFLRDRCDPKLFVEVYADRTSSLIKGSRDRILHFISPAYKDTTAVHNVLSKKILLEYFPIGLEVIINVYDDDSRYLQEKIAEFNFQSANISKSKVKRRIGKKKSISMEINLKCVPEYYGESCTKYCHPASPIWRCDPETGELSCLHHCGHGSCRTDGDIKEDQSCVCETGWKGEFCNEYDEHSCLYDCVHGSCRTDRASESDNSCICETGWQGIFCNETADVTFQNQLYLPGSNNTSQTVLMIIFGQVSTALLVLTVLILAIIFVAKYIMKTRLTSNMFAVPAKDTALNRTYVESSISHVNNWELNRERYSKSPGVILYDHYQTVDGNNVRLCQSSSNPSFIKMSALPAIPTDDSDTYEGVSEKSVFSNQEYEIPK